MEHHVQGEPLQCLICGHQWLVYWRKDSEIRTVCEINGRCINCGDNRVILYEKM